MLSRNLLRNRTAELSERERSLLESAIAETRFFPAGHIVVKQDVPVNISTLLVEGLMTRHVDAPDGKRHLVAVHVPGDFVDLHAYALKKLDHDVGALTDVTVAVFPMMRSSEFRCWTANSPDGYGFSHCSTQPCIANGFTALPGSAQFSVLLTSFAR